MFLQSWIPHITARGATTTHVVEPALTLSAVLSCPCCGHLNEVKTDGHLLHNVSLSTSIDWEREQLEKRRDCEKCGTTSSLPAPDRTKLLQEAIQQITPEWVKDREETLKAAA